MRIVPISFGSGKGKQMLQHMKAIIEDPSGLIAIDKRFDKLLISLRSATANEYDLIKEDTSHNDLLDALRLSLLQYRKR